MLFRFLPLSSEFVRGTDSDTLQPSKISIPSPLIGSMFHRHQICQLLRLSVPPLPFPYHPSSSPTYGKLDGHTWLDPKPGPLGDPLWAIGFRRPLTLLLTNILGIFGVDTSAQSIENLVSKEMDVVTSILGLLVHSVDTSVHNSSKIEIWPK